MPHYFQCNKLTYTKGHVVVYVPSYTFNCTNSLTINNIFNIDVSKLNIFNIDLSKLLH